MGRRPAQQPSGRAPMTCAPPRVSGIRRSNTGTTSPSRRAALMQAMLAQPANPLGLHAFVADFARKAENLTTRLSDGRLRVIQGVARATRTTWAFTGGAQASMVEWYRPTTPTVRILCAGSARQGACLPVRPRRRAHRHGERAHQGMEGHVRRLFCPSGPSAPGKSSSRSIRPRTTANTWTARNAKTESGRFWTAGESSCPKAIRMTPATPRRSTAWATARTTCSRRSWRRTASRCSTARGAIWRRSRPRASASPWCRRAPTPARCSRSPGWTGSSSSGWTASRCARSTSRASRPPIPTCAARNCSMCPPTRRPCSRTRCPAWRPVMPVTSATWWA